MQPLQGKTILIIESDAVFSCFLVDYLHSLGAASENVSRPSDALTCLKTHTIDLILCSLPAADTEADSVEFLNMLRIEGDQTPVIILTGNKTMTSVAHVLRLGVQDVLVKPMDDLQPLRNALLASFYPQLFDSPALRQLEFMESWQSLSQSTHEHLHLLRTLQPPVYQSIAHCSVHYRQLTSAENLGLILDIAAISDDELAFYCLDIGHGEEQGILVALLLRAFFNKILQENMKNQAYRLPNMESLLKQLNQLFLQSNISGVYPLLVGYYHRVRKQLLLVSAGLRANISANQRQIILNSGVPLGQLNSVYLNQVSVQCDEWYCQITGESGNLKLTVVPEEPDFI